MRFFFAFFFRCADVALLRVRCAARWTLWFDNPPKKASKENWGEALKPLSSFDTIEDFWACVGRGPLRRVRISRRLAR